MIIMNKKHYNVVCALIFKDEDIFCVQRPNKGEVGLKWEFPGGKIEKNETKKEALIREIYEELNCKIKVIKYLDKVYHQYNTFNITLYAYKCSMIDYKFELNEHIDYCWTNLHNLKNLDLAKADVKLISKLNKVYNA